PANGDALGGGYAEIAPYHAGDPAEKALMGRRVEPHLGAQGGDAGFAGIDAEDEAGGIAGQQIEQDENDERRDEKGGGEGEETAEDEKGHGEIGARPPPLPASPARGEVWHRVCGALRLAQQARLFATLPLEG